MDWIVPPTPGPLKFLFEALTPNVTVCEGGAFKKVIMIKWGHEDRALIF